jgi:hypothetical protein
MNSAPFSDGEFTSDDEKAVAGVRQAGLDIGIRKCVRHHMSCSHNGMKVPH